MRWFRESRVAATIEPDRSNAFAAFVAGKRVAVVGPAATLLGLGGGPRIDSYDLVVRFNEAFEHLPVPDAWQHDVGARCDVVYANQVVFRHHLLEQPRTSQWRVLRSAGECGLRYLVCTNNSLSYRSDGRPESNCPPLDRGMPAAMARVLHDVAPGVRLRVAHAASERAMSLLAGCYGRTGFVALLDLIACDVAELFVTGMSFYHGGGHLFSPHAPELRPDGNRDGSAASDGRGGGHDSRRELDVFRALATAHPASLRVDEPLAKLLHYGPGLDERSND